jgi:hypothetical protein
MESKGSLPCSQEPSTGPYPKPDQSSPYHPTFSVEDEFEYYPHLRLGLPSCLFPTVFYTNILDAFFYPLFLLHVLPISSSLTWSFKLNLAKSKGFAVFPTSRHVFSLRSKYSQHPVLKHPQSMFLP